MLEIFLARCQNDRKVRRSKDLTLSINIRVVGKSKDRFGMIPGRNTKVMISWGAKAQVPFVSSLSTL